MKKYIKRYMSFFLILTITSAFLYVDTSAQEEKNAAEPVTEEVILAPRTPEFAELEEISPLTLEEEYVPDLPSFRVTPIDNLGTEEKEKLQEQIGDIEMETGAGEEPASDVNALASSSSNKWNFPDVMNGIYNPLLDGGMNNQNEQISTYTGDLNLSYTDLSLPGRNGMDFTLTRYYKSAQTMVPFEEDNSTQYTSNGNNAPYPGVSYAENTALTKQYDLGLGWGFNFPMVDERGEEVYFYAEGGSIYKYNPDVPFRSQLEGYTSNAAKFAKDSSYYIAENRSSKYSFLDEAGNISYFDGDGKIVSKQDGLGNEILYDYKYVPTMDLLRDGKLIQYLTTSGNMTYDTSHDQLVFEKTGSGGASGSATISLNNLNAEGYELVLQYLAGSDWSGEFTGNMRVETTFTFDDGEKETYLVYEENFNTQPGENEVQTIEDIYDFRHREWDVNKIQIKIDITNANGQMLLGGFKLSECTPLISKITDTVGRTIEFDYGDNDMYKSYKTFNAPQVLTVTAKTPSGAVIKELKYYRKIIEYKFCKFDSEGALRTQHADRYHVLVGVDNGEYYSPLQYNIGNSSVVTFGTRGVTGASNVFKGRLLLVSVGHRNSKTCYSYEAYKKALTSGEKNAAWSWMMDFRVHERFEVPYTSAEAFQPPGEGEDVYESFIISGDNGALSQDPRIVPYELEDGAVKENTLAYNYAAGTHELTFNEPGGFNRASSTKIDWGIIEPGQYVVKVTDGHGKATSYEYETQYYEHDLYAWLEEQRLGTETADKEERTGTIADGIVLRKVTVADESSGGTGDFTSYLYEYGKTLGYNFPEKTTITQSVNGETSTSILMEEKCSEGFPSYVTEVMTPAENQNRDSYMTYYYYDYIEQNDIYKPNRIRKKENGVYISQEMVYDSIGRMIKTIDELGDETEMFYENDAHPWMLTKQVTEDVNKDGSGVSAQTVYEYEDTLLLGPTTTKVLQDGENWVETSVVYDAKYGGILEETNAMGGVTSYMYDSLGRPIYIVYPSYQGENGEEHIEESYVYTPHVLYNGRAYLKQEKIVYLVTEEGQEQVAFENSYFDDYGNAVKVESDIGTALYTYDSYRRLVSYKSPEDNAEGRTTYTYDYDALGRLSGVTDINGYNGIIYGINYKESYFKPTGGQNQNQYKEVYDIRGNVLATYIQPVPGTWEQTAAYTYSPFGRLLEQEDGKGKKTVYTYDKKGNLLQTTLPDGSTIAYTYGKGGLPKAMIQQSGGEEFVYNRTYHADGTLASAWQEGTDEESSPYTYTYNTAGLLASITDPKGQTMSYGYDQTGNTTSITKQDESLSYTYNRFGLVAAASRQRGGETSQASYTYSDLGYLLKKTEGGQVLTYTYDLYGHVLSVTDQLGLTTSYTYNDKNQITAMEAEGKFITFFYYPNGLLQKVSYPVLMGGQALSVTYTYDNANRLTGYTAAGVDLGEAYTYDGNGNITAIGSGTEFIYDDLNRVVMSTYEEADNLENLYGYDARGNRTKHASSRELPEQKPYTYTYDSSNRLTKVMDGDTVIAEYTYDIDGIRNSKTVNGVTTTYYTDGANVLAEKTGNREAHNLWAGRVYARKDDGKWYYYLYDGLMDVRKVIDEDGNEVASYLYDEWGNILEKSGTYADQNPIRYKGEYYDVETDFIYLRARYYDPSVGRFIKEDTHWDHTNMIYGDSVYNNIPVIDAILQAANLYVYCANNPVTFLDIWGYWKMSLRDLYNGLVNSYGGDNRNGNSLNVYNNNQKAKITLWGDRPLNRFSRTATFDLEIPTSGKYKDRAIIEPSEFFTKLKIAYQQYDGTFEVGNGGEILNVTINIVSLFAKDLTSLVLGMVGMIPQREQGTYKYSTYIIENDVVQMVVVQIYKKGYDGNGQEIWTEYQTFIR